MPGIPAAPPPANGGNETKPSDTAAAPSATTQALPDLANSVPTDATKATQDVVDKVTQGVQAFNDTVKAPEETFELEVDGEGTTDKAKVTITKKITDPANGKVHLKGENWKNKDNKGSTILVRLKGYDAQTGAENIFKQENPASQQSPADGKAADPEIYWKIEAKEDGTFERDYDLPNLTPGQGLKLEFETNAATNDFSRKKTTESLVIGGTEYVEKQAAPARAVPRAMAAEAAAKAAEIESTAKEAAESAKAEASATGSAVANAVMAPQAPGGSAEPTDSGKATASTTPSAAPSTQPSTSSTAQTPPSTTPSTSGTASSKTSTPPNNSGTSQSTTASTQPPKDDSSSTDTIKDINYLLKEIKNFDKAFENLLGAAALAALSSSGGSNIPGLPGGSNNSTKTTAPTTPRAGGQARNAGGNKTGTGTSGNGTAGKAPTGGASGGKSTAGGAAAGTKTTQKGTSTNALSGLGSLSSLLGGTGRGTSVGGTRTSGTITGGATRSTNGTGATRTTTGTNGTSPATGARVINPNTNGRAAAGARAAGAAGAGSAKATTSNSASASSKPQPKHTPKPPVKTRDQLTQKNAHGVTGTLKNETLTMKIPRLKSGDWAYLYIYSADTTQKPVGVAWAQLDSTGSVKLDTKDLPDGEYTVAAVDEKDQLVGWVDMKLGEIKNAAVEGDNNDKVVAAQAGVMSATDWWMIGASMLIPLLTASMIYAFRRPRRS
ncbi:hypothetical protein HMPREF0299_6037 [Corynebacterium matruchotii ATCC 14266]|uniref:Uncharacterized protein n=2 Tax=Corynebacterium matruchotii TaxID=43768 RepID=E0DCI8_9CORY|nr:hypothetical protein [Corynebacterium matruchotii]EFM49742.1 hypothetical protein HMPREF0299_6037 [Corynebacterium matruchotii ATCC 14266]